MGSYSVYDIIDNWTWKDKLWYKWKRICEKPSDIWWAIRNMWNLSHCLKSDVKFGTYCDKPYLIESALFETLSNYVSKDGEDAFEYQDLNDDDAIHVDKYRDMIKILHFYHVELPELNKKLDDCYERRTGKMMLTDIEGDAKGCKKVDWVYESDEAKEESYKAMEESIVLDELIHELTTKYLFMIIELRGYMWT